MDTGFTPPDRLPALNGSPEEWRISAAAREGWRELGFRYDCDVRRKCWTFRADRKGVAAFAAVVRKFLEEPESQEVGEHVHLGPYSNLRLTTAMDPAVSWRGIAGRRSDFERLAEELERLAGGAAEGNHALGDAWTSGDSYRMILTVEGDGFDPAAAES